MICTNCGHNNPQGSRYCNNCGQLLEGSSTEKRYTVRTSRRRKSRPIPTTYILFFVLLVVLCVLLYFAYRAIFPPSEIASEEIKSIKIDPSSKQMTLDAQLNFSLYGITGDGKQVKLKDEVTWTVTPSEIGQIDKNGLFSPSKAGEAIIEATYKQFTATANIKVVAQSNVAKISVFPENVTLAVNEEQQFQAKAEDKDGNELDIKPQWSVLEKDLGTIDDNGLFKALKPGNATILAIYSYNQTELSATAGVIIREGPPLSVRRIEVIPSTVELQKGEIYQFTCKGFDQNNQAETVTCSWEVIGSAGIIDEKGNFQAVEEGEATVQAIYSGMTATAKVTVSEEGLSFLRYSFPAVGCSFDYPSTWEIRESETLVKFIAPTHTDTLFNYTAIFGYEELAEGRDLDSYVQENKDWAAGRFSQPTFEEEDRTFGETKGKILKMTAPGYQALLGCAVSNHWGFYYFSYAPTKQFPDFEAIFLRMLQSWVIPSTSSTSPTTTTSSGPLTYSDTTYGFSFIYPDDWQIGTLPGVAIYITGPMVDNYLPNMTVKVEELTTPMSAGEFADKIEKERLASFYQDYESVSLTETVLGGIPAAKRVFTLTFQGQPLKDIQYYLTKDGKGYLITFDMSLDGFDQVSPIFEQIASSFTFK